MKVGVENGVALSSILRCKELQFEQGLPVSWLSEEVGASKGVIRRWVKAFFGFKPISHLVDRAFSLKASFSQLRNGLRILGDREKRLGAKALQRTGAVTLF